MGEGDGARLDRKPGELVDPETSAAPVQRPRFVSRGGEKLDAALEAFAIEVGGRVCLDVGASTGGFSDVLLQRGAARVYALDVGRGQLADVLRRDPRVISMERTHAARLDPTSADPVALPEPVSLAVIDVSFISLGRILPGVKSALAAAGEIVALVKPQFEAAPADVPGGVVRDPAVQQQAVEQVLSAAVRLGLGSRGQMESPLLGAKGNHEFLIHLVNG